MTLVKALRMELILNLKNTTTTNERNLIPFNSVESFMIKLFDRSMC